MDGAIGRVRSALIPSRPSRRVESRGKEEDPRGFEEEFERQTGEKSPPRSPESESDPDPTPPKPDSELGAHLDVIA